MPLNDVPDYTEDWIVYWEQKSQGRVSSTLRRAAEKPTTNFLPVQPGEINPLDFEDLSINKRHLRECPDSVLSDCRTGFIEFVEMTDFVDEPSPYLDVVPIIFTQNHFNLRDIFYRESSLDDLPANQICTINGILGDLPEQTKTSRKTAFECTKGHVTSVRQPVYSENIIDICGREGCHQSVYQISQGTRFLDVLEFDIRDETGGLPCVSTGVYADLTQFEELNEAGVELSLVGIPRNMFNHSNEPEVIFEVFSLEIV